MAKSSRFPGLEESQEFDIFSSGCLDHSANILIGGMEIYIVYQSNEQARAPLFKTNDR